MAQIPLTARIVQDHFDALHAHLFPGDGDEHGALLLCGFHEGSRENRLLVREVVLAEEGVDFVLSERGYKEFTAAFVAHWARYCAIHKLAYISVHNHSGIDRVSFSGNDMKSHQNGYPALLQLTKGGPVGAFVFALNAVAGDIWFPDGRRDLDYLTIVGPRIRTLRQSLLKRGRKKKGDDTYDRQYRLFGDKGQQILQGVKGTLIGLGGGGSLMNEWLARLGIGGLLGIDPKIIKKSNLPRVVGSTRSDVRARRAKVEIGRRVAKAANPEIDYQAVLGDVRDEDIALLAADSDFIVLAGDTFASRNVFNRLVQQYLIPGFHVGTKIETDPASGDITRVRAETRLVLPGSGKGCLRCCGLIPEKRLREEELVPEDLEAQNYLGNAVAGTVPEPSVITLNVLSAAQAANDIMMMFTGLFSDGVELESRRHNVTKRETFEVGHGTDVDCPHCSELPGSSFAMGDRMRLPCRIRS